ncbi:hypothetical protein [Actinoplanes subtropicus]|uniref:hypothetical protein n=1 Tax=Actinoplanes subtropicus TaxID=543632 RepID=UPI00068A591E|nr:hypothetical protein [Actinoplanes subtropicus]
MPEQPHRYERTLDMPPQDPWGDHPTTPGPMHPPAGADDRTAAAGGDDRTAVAGGYDGTAVAGGYDGTAVAGGYDGTAVAGGYDGTAVAGGAAPSPFTQGRARVNPQAPQRQYADHEPTGVGWPGAAAPPPRGMSWSWHELRRGSEWTTAAVLFAFVCWGIWALSGGGSMTTSIILLAVTLIVAVGVFCLARVVGYYVLERAFRRRRRSARGSHLVTALFLAGVGVTDLQQTEWVMTAYHWVSGHIS